MLTVVASLLIAQTKTLPPPEEAYLGGHLEAAIGLKTHATIVFGQYINRVSRPYTDGLSGYYDMNPKDTLARQPIKVGYAAWKVSNSTLEGKPCILFESDGTRKRTRKYRDEHGMDVTNKTPIQRYRKVWLSPEGVPLRETSGIRGTGGTYEIDATFKKEEIEIKVGNPKGVKTTTIIPAGGIELFANEFKPMVDGEKVLLKEKTFARLDPVTGGVVNVTAKVGAKFEGTIFLKKFTGHRIDFMIGDRMEVAFISNAMHLLQVNIPHGETLLAENDPSEGTGKIRSGGGR